MREVHTKVDNRHREMLDRLVNEVFGTYRAAIETGIEILYAIAYRSIRLKKYVRNPERLRRELLRMEMLYLDRKLLLQDVAKTVEKMVNQLLGGGVRG